MPVVTLTISFVAGYIFFLLSTSPKKYKRKLPNFNFWRLDILPCLRIKIRGKWLHIHHWTWLGVALAAVINSTGNWFESHLILKGILSGGLIQGLTYPDRFKLFEPHDN